MAILINDIIQGIGAEVITASEAESYNLEPGLHIMKETKNIDGFSNNNWAIINSYDQDSQSARAQIWIPLYDNQDTSEFYFIRTASNSGQWSVFRKFVSGDKLITLSDVESNIFELVDNSDPLNPKIRQDDTKADKITGDFKPGSYVIVDENGNIKSSEKDDSWIKTYDVDVVDGYDVELIFAEAVDNLTDLPAEYEGYGYSTFTANDVVVNVQDKNGNKVNLDAVRISDIEEIQYGNNSLKLVKYTTSSSELAGIPANALVFNGVKTYKQNKSTNYVGTVKAKLTYEFTIEGTRFSEDKMIIINAHYGKRNEWIEQGIGSRKYKLEGTYVDPLIGQDPMIYSSDEVDAKINHITIPADRAGQVMLYGNPIVAGQVYGSMNVTNAIGDENSRDDVTLPTEKAIADYVDQQVADKGVASLVYNTNTHKVTLTKNDNTVLETIIPVATASVDGLMTKDDKQSINNLVAQVSMLSGKSRIVGNVGTNPTPDDIQAFWETVKGDVEPDVMVGSIVVNMDQGAPVGHQWMFVQLQDGSYTWIDMGTGQVATATNNNLGVVKGVEAGVGYIYKANFINQKGSATPYLGKTLSNSVDTTLTIRITSVDGDGNVTGYELTPKSGNQSKFLSKVEFKNTSIGEDIFRFDISSLPSAQGEGYASVNADGELYTNGYATLREQVEFQLDNKVDKQGINIWSKDKFITISGESPNFAIGLNIAGSREMIDLTPLIDGQTTEWNLLENEKYDDILGDVVFWYGDGRLIPGRDYDLTIVRDEETSEVIEKTLRCRNVPAWDPSENRTLYAEVTKMSFISDIKGIGTIKSDAGTLQVATSGPTVSLEVNRNEVLDSPTVKQTLATPVESKNIVTEGSVMELLQALTNNVKFLMDNTVWKNSNTDLPLKIAFQTEKVTPESGVNKIQINPNDLGQE